jgi:hypothetical protein
MAKAEIVRCFHRSCSKLERLRPSVDQPKRGATFLTFSATLWFTDAKACVERFSAQSAKSSRHAPRQKLQDALETPDFAAQMKNTSEMRKHRQAGIAE